MARQWDAPILRYMERGVSEPVEKIPDAILEVPPLTFRMNEFMCVHGSSIAGTISPCLARGVVPATTRCVLNSASESTLVPIPCRQE
jgi:hypothetical protein